MAAKRKGVFWSDEEVEELLEIILTLGKASKVMTSTHLPTRAIFSVAARRLSARGFHRTPDQCRSKFKCVKASFFAALEAWQGIPSQSGKPPHFATMMRLWEQAGRPSWMNRRHASVQRGREAHAEVEGEPGVESSVAAGDAEDLSLVDVADTTTVQQDVSAVEEAAAEEQCDPEPAPSTSAHGTVSTITSSRSLEDLFVKIEEMEGRILNALTQFQSRITILEWEVSQLGRRIQAVERRMDELDRSRSQQELQGQDP